MLQTLALQGRYNSYNTMAGGIATRLLDIRKEQVQTSLLDFQSIEHRLEYVLTVHGIEFVNDSRATNINAAWYALDSMTKPVIWIVGGQDKNNDYLELQDVVAKNVKAIICIGKNNAKIKKAFKKMVPVILEADTMFDAVMMSYRTGKSGDTVLLSPACASFDQFENFEDRGRQFKRFVREL